MLHLHAEDGNGGVADLDVSNRQAAAAAGLLSDGWEILIEGELPNRQRLAAGRLEHVVADAIRPARLSGG